MKIAQIAPLYESVPPKLYGGTERVVSYLTEELVRLGHDVTLFASGDSMTSAQLKEQCPCALRLAAGSQDPIARHILMIERLAREASEFDMIHSHIDYLPFSVFRRLDTPAVTTLHGRLDLPDLQPLFREFWDMPVISISQAQRRPLPYARWMGTVYHGLPKDLYGYREGGGNYLAFIGRISPEKRVEIAIQIAKKAGIPLKIAAKVDKVDRNYFEEAIRPLLDHPLIEFIGEIGESEKNHFLGQAMALLFPINWPEPFGLVMVEAMACGTPVIACCRGSVSEIVDHGVTGFFVESIEEAVYAIRNLSPLTRLRCRRHFEERFTSTRMALDYLKIYQQLTGEKENQAFPGVTLYG